MILPETHAMLISIREKWAVHTNTGKTLFVEREYDDDVQNWTYIPVSNMGEETLSRCVKIIERQPEAHGHWPEKLAPEDVTLFIGCQDEPPEPEYMPDKHLDMEMEMRMGEGIEEVPCGE